MPKDGPLFPSTANPASWAAEPKIHATERPEQVYRLALQALDTADMPMVQADARQVALLMSIVSACAEWIIASHRQGDPVAELLAERSAAVAPVGGAEHVALIALMGFAIFDSDLSSVAGGISTIFCGLALGMCMTRPDIISPSPTTQRRIKRGTIALTAVAVVWAVVAGSTSIASAHPPTEKSEQVADGVESFQVWRGFRPIITGYEEYTENVTVTIPTGRTIRVPYTARQCWTAANPGPFGAVGCFTWTAYKTVPETKNVTIPVKKKRPIYGREEIYETRYRTKYKTVTTSSHNDGCNGQTLSSQHHTAPENHRATSVYYDDYGHNCVIYRSTERRSTIDWGGLAKTVVGGLKATGNVLFDSLCHPVNRTAAAGTARAIAHQAALNSTRAAIVASAGAISGGTTLVVGAAIWTACEYANKQSSNSDNNDNSDDDSDSDDDNTAAPPPTATATPDPNAPPADYSDHECHTYGTRTFCYYRTPDGWVTRQGPPPSS